VSKGALWMHCLAVMAASMVPGINDAFSALNRDCAGYKRIKHIHAKHRRGKRK